MTIMALFLKIADQLLTPSMNVLLTRDIDDNDMAGLKTQLLVDSFTRILMNFRI